MVALVAGTTHTRALSLSSKQQAKQAVLSPGLHCHRLLTSRLVAVKQKKGLSESYSEVDCAY
jgi:hypothetical protein